MSMFRSRLACRVLLGGSLLLLAATFAQAQATRTWVSGVGDDANPCSRTAPCKTFAGAISSGNNQVVNNTSNGTFNGTDANQ